MAESSTSFGVNNQPSKRRGKSNKTIILNAIRASSLQGINKDSTKEEAEEAFFKHIATSALTLDDPNRGMCLKLLADKGWANLKPSSEMINFEFDEGAKPHVQANQVMKGVSDGFIPPDIGALFIGSIKHMIDIEESTELKKRIEDLERKLGIV